jgi:hypothetical protein
MCRKGVGEGPHIDGLAFIWLDQNDLEAGLGNSVATIQRPQNRYEYANPLHY